MFGNKKKKEDKIEKTPIAVTTIPEEFYAGTNPVVKFKNIEKEIDLTDSHLSKADKKLLEKETAVGSNQPLHPVNLLSNRKFLFVGGLLVFLCIAIGSGIYYVVFQNKSTPSGKITSSPSSTTTVSNIDTNTSTASPVIETPTTSVEVSTSSLSSESAIDFPSVVLGDSVDTDSDGLTDREEELFNTDLGVPDTDNDSYPDGHETYYLYNPAGEEPMRVIDSGSVKEFVNPVFGYKLYYPNTWAVGNVDSEYRDVLFSTITGENIEVRVFNKQAGEDFASWFARIAPREKYDDLVEFETYFKEKGWRRNDFLVYYFESQDKVYVIVYHTTDSTVVNYRSIIKLTARSFELSSDVIDMPLSGNQTSTSSVPINTTSSLEIDKDKYISSSTTSTSL